MTKITAVVISNTSIRARLLQSLEFADEVIVVQDQAVGKVYQKNKVKYLYHPLAGDFSAQRNFALEKAKGDWVFFVDDDEIVSSELIREIKNKVAQNKFSAFYIPRKDLVFHQQLKYGEVADTQIIRLANRTAGKFVRPVHEVWKIKGKIGDIRSPLYHIKDDFISRFTGKMSLYGQLDAPQLAKENKPYSPFRLFIYPLSKFFLNYVAKRGFLDGYPGLFMAYLMSIQSLTVRVYQWTNKNSS